MAYTPGAAFPAGVTALRFTTSAGLQPGYSGIANLTMRSTQPLTPATTLFNDVFGRELAPGGLVLTASGNVRLAGQAAASLVGTVFNDANMNNLPDAGEAGIAGVTATLTCVAGPACTAGEAHSAVTDASGAYSFAPGATVDGQANFPGLASGSWTLSIAPAATWNNVGSTAGTVNGAASGTAAGRSISGIVVSTGATAVDYLFAEHQLGDLTINKALTLPVGVTGPFDFAFTATCDLPTAGSVYNATLAGYPTTTAVTIEDLPAGANCTVTEDTPLPTPPASYAWATPTAPAAVVIAADTAVAVTVTNALEAQLGSITVTKALTLPGDVPGPFNFSYTATCDLPTAGSIYTGTLSGYPATTSVTIANVPAGAQCVVSEGALPAAPVNYSWGPAAADANVTVPLNSAAAVSMASTLVRLQAGIEVTKTLALPSGVTGPFSFGFTATCNLPTPGSTYTATLANYPASNKVTIANVPAGASCTVTENQPLPTAPTNYEWAAPSAPAPVVVPSTGVAAVGVTNALTAKQGNIQVNATTTLPDGVTGPFSFTLTATCDLPTAGTVHTATLTAPPGAMAMITGVQAGAQCAMTQTTPDAPVGYRWADPAFDQTMVTVQADTDMPVALTNSLTRMQAANPVPVPVDSRVALLLLAMLMAAAAGLHMRKR